MFHVKHLSGNFVSRCKSTRFCIAKNIRILEFETLEKMFHVKHLGVETLSHKCYNVRVGNEQCQFMRIQIFVFTRKYLCSCKLIRAKAANQRTEGCLV